MDTPSACQPVRGRHSCRSSALLHRTHHGISFYLLVFYVDAPGDTLAGAGAATADAAISDASVGSSSR